jgi:hypothetical protein
MDINMVRDRAKYEEAQTRQVTMKVPADVVIGHYSRGLLTLEEMIDELTVIVMRSEPQVVQSGDKCDRWKTIPVVQKLQDALSTPMKAFCPSHQEDEAVQSVSWRYPNHVESFYSLQLACGAEVDY